MEGKEGRIRELEGRLKKARDDYYNLSPSMSDPEYDALRDELADLSPASPEVRAVGAEVPKVSVWDKVEHVMPMGSLDKVNTEEGLTAWAGATESKRFLITHKIDGSSMELVYSAGKLVRCVTRGDGLVGEDVTENVRKVPDVPEELPIKHEDITVRGEIVMLKAVFEEKYAGEYSNPRNTAAGKVRDKKRGGTDCANLSFMAFTLMSASAPGTESKRLLALRKMGFSVPDYGEGGLEEVQAWHKKTAEERRTIPYEIDGTVVRVDDVRDQEGLGEIHMRPMGQVAYKFESAKGVTRIVDVKWQVGPTGRITPVANVEPVSIGGVTITSISLHNLAMFRELGLSRGDEVLVSRRNDVIPYVEENLSRRET